MKRITLGLFLLSLSQLVAQTICTGGFAAGYPCDNMDLMSHLDFPAIGGNANTGGNDCWGWTDPLDGREYAIMGCTSHTAFVDITNPTAPVYKGKVVSQNGVSSIWRDIKVYNNYAFIVSEAAGHGMQVFDLTRLRNITTPQTFTPDAHYAEFGNCHNIAINEATGYAYCVGSNTFFGGPHVVNIQDPLNPVFAFGYADENYTHDAQIVIYDGPDPDYQGKEIFFGANEDKVVVLDVTDKQNPIFLSSFFYSETGYTHQGWLTPDQKYWMLGDELDELDFGFQTRTVLIDMTDLDNPVLKSDYYGTTEAIDHNGYTLNNEFYLANYRAGLRLMDAVNIENGEVTEIGFFDTYPQNNNAAFDGAWSVYPYFASGNIIISDINRGLFVVRKGAALSLPEFTGDDTLKISPNPAGNVATISASGTIETVAVYDVLGKNVKTFSGISSPEFSFQVADLAPGIYVVKVNNSLVRKMIKQ